MDSKLLQEIYQKAQEKEAHDTKEKDDKQRYRNEVKAKQDADEQKRLEAEWPTRMSAAPEIFRWIEGFMTTDLASFLFSKQDSIRLYEEPGRERTNWDYISLYKDGSLRWHYMYGKGQSGSAQFKTVDELARGLPLPKLCCFNLEFSDPAKRDGRGIYQRLKYNAENCSNPLAFTY